MPGQRRHVRSNRNTSWYRSADTLAQQAQVAAVNARRAAYTAAAAAASRPRVRAVGTSTEPLAGYVPAPPRRSRDVQTNPIGVVPFHQQGPMTAVYRQYIADTKKLTAKFTKIIRQRNQLVQSGTQSRINFWP